MIRRRFNKLAAVSLVLSTALAALWMRSETSYDSITRRSWGPTTEDQHVIQVRSSEGRVELVYAVLHIPSNAIGSTAGVAIPTPAAQWEHSSGGHAVAERRKWFWFNHPADYWLRRPAPSSITVDCWSIGLRLWPAALLLSLPSIAWLALRRQRRQDGYCATCGYDLRATPDRCPECGTIPSAGAVL
jgi:hypothetical protein